MRFPTSAALAVLLASSVSLAQAQTAAAPAAAAGQAQPQATPATVIANVGGLKITEQDLAQAYSNLPDSAKSQPQVVQQLLQELISEKAILVVARREGLDKTPDVRAAIATASAAAAAAEADQVLQQEFLRKTIGPLLTEDKIKAAYDAQYAGKSGDVEVHAEHILVKTPQEAQAIIDQLNKGADFATLAKTKSTDSGSGAAGGDLGWFKKGEMVPSFSDAAFAMKPGQVSQKPVQSVYGWHVIKVLDTRVDPVPTYQQVHDSLAQSMQQQAVNAELNTVRASVKIVQYDQNGKPRPAPAASK